MKKLIMFSFLAILVSCSTSETPEVVPPPLTGNDVIFVANVLGKHTILNIEYTVGADGNILIGDVITYYFFIASSETEAYYTTPAKTEYLGVSIVTHEDGSKELKIYKKDRVEFWLDYIDIKLTTNHDISTAGVDIFVITHNTKTIIINGTSYTMSANTGHLENGGNTAYQYAGFKTEHQAYYRDATSKGYLGVSIVNNMGSDETKIYKKDRLDFWATKEEVAFTTPHEVGYIDPFIKIHGGTEVTIDGSRYIVDSTTGDLGNAFTFCGTI